MTRIALPLTLLLLASGCDNGGKDSEVTDITCDVTVTTYPASGAADHYYMDPIEFYLSDVDASATVSSEIAGTTSVSEDGKTVTFTPDAPLSPSTAYSVTLDYCGGAAELSFTTSALGTEIADPNTLVGKTYNVNLADANIVSPAGVGSILGSVLTTPILIGVISAGSSLEMIGAIGVEGGTTQDSAPPASTSRPPPSPTPPSPSAPRTRPSTSRAPPSPSASSKSPAPSPLTPASLAAAPSPARSTPATSRPPCPTSATTPPASATCS